MEIEVELADLARSVKKQPLMALRFYHRILKRCLRAVEKELTRRGALD